MKTIKTILAVLFLVIGVTAQAQDKLVVKTADSNDMFESVSRIVVDFTKENPIVRSSQKSIVCTSEFQIQMEYENLEDAVNATKAEENRKGVIYDLSGRMVQGPVPGGPDGWSAR